MPRRGRESGCREGAFWLGDSEQGRNNPLKSPSGQSRGDGLMEQLGYIVIYPSVAHHSGSLTPRATFSSSFIPVSWRPCVWVLIHSLHAVFHAAGGTLEQGRKQLNSTPP